MRVQAKVLCLALAAINVAGQSGSCKGTGNCNTDGSSSTYTETISGSTRQIRASGCPNNNPIDVCVGDNPNPANTQDWVFDIPATPLFNKGTYADSLSNALSLQQLGGIIGITRNGIEIRSCYGGAQYGTCDSYSNSATNVEGDTFEYCRGHGNPYHYHEAPVCLLQQMGTRTDGSSPQVGWAADGFPIYGNLGPGGVEIKRCGANGAHASYCMDSCGGYYGDDYNDDFKYRYFMAGPNTISTVASGRSPAIQLLEADGYFPFVPLCLLGCGSMTANGNDRNPKIGSKMPACTGDASAGTSNGYQASALSGVTTQYTPQSGSVSGKIATTTNGATTTTTNGATTTTTNGATSTTSSSTVATSTTVSTSTNTGTTAASTTSVGATTIDASTTSAAASTTSVEATTIDASTTSAAASTTSVGATTTTTVPVTTFVATTLTAQVQIPMDIPSSVSSGSDLLSNTQFKTAMEAALVESLGLPGEALLEVTGISLSRRRLLEEMDAVSGKSSDGAPPRILVASNVKLTYRIIFPAGVTASVVIATKNTASSGAGSNTFTQMLQTQSTEKLAAASLSSTYSITGSPVVVGSATQETAQVKDKTSSARFAIIKSVFLLSSLRICFTIA